MYKTLILLLGAFLLNTSLYGQNISREDIVKFKIKSITTINSEDKVLSIDFYNEYGDIIRTGEKDKGTIKTIREFIYNDNRLLIEEKSYTSEGKILNLYTYFYNSQNQLIKKELSDGDIRAIWAFEYDETGNRIKETQKSGTMGNSVTVFNYSGKLLIKEEITNETIGKEQKIIYKYNDKGQLIEKVSRHFYFNTTITQTYSYDATGKLISLSEESSNGVSSTATYQYDSNGLLISDIWKSSLGKTENKTKYIIEL